MEVDKNERLETYQGFAHLIFVALSGGKTALLGHLVIDDELVGRTAFGLSGTDITDQIEKTCSCEQDDRWFEFSLIEFQESKEMQTTVLMNGGDRFKLESDFVSFSTETLLLDESARDHAKKYKPELVDRCISVSLGPMTIYSLSFAKLAPEQKKFFEIAPRMGTHQHVVIENQ